MPGVPVLTHARGGCVALAADSCRGDDQIATGVLPCLASPVHRAPRAAPLLALTRVPWRPVPLDPDPRPWWEVRVRTGRARLAPRRPRSSKPHPRVHNTADVLREPIGLERGRQLMGLRVVRAVPAQSGDTGSVSPSGGGHQQRDAPRRSSRQSDGPRPQGRRAPRRPIGGDAGGASLVASGGRPPPAAPVRWRAAGPVTCRNGRSGMPMNR